MTVADSRFAESRSVITTTGDTVIGDPVVPAAIGVATSTGATDAPGTPTTVTAVTAGTTLVL
ncbi:MAG: hypothetical protein WA965_04830, partial [Mycobacterium sp.]